MSLGEEVAREQSSHEREAGLNSPIEQDRPSAPKRRRLMTQEMRGEGPQSAANGAHTQSNLQSHPSKNGISGSSQKNHSTNGVSPVHTNGFSSNSAPARSQKFFGHDREEVTRLLIQGLGDLGYETSANSLCQESGYEVESPVVAAFRHAVLHGDWSEAESILFRSDAAPDGGGVSIRNGGHAASQRIDFIEGADRDYLKFIIREQKYLECLERQDTGRALMVLQTELQPLRPALWDRNRLNGLSEYVWSTRGEKGPTKASSRPLLTMR